MPDILPQSENDLKETIERLNFALNAAGIGTWDLDPLQNKVVWDTRCRELFGFAPDETTSYEQVLKYMHQDDALAVAAAVKKALDPHNDGAYEVRYRTIGAVDGKIRWVLSKGKAYFNGQGIAYRFAGTAQDITDAVLSQQKIDTANRIAQLALENTSSGYFLLTLATGQVTYSPLLARVVTGDEQEDLHQDNFATYIHPEDAYIRAQAFEMSEQTGKVDYECRVIHNDGSIHWMRSKSTYLYDADGNRYALAGTAHDTTEEHLQKEAEMMLLLALSENDARFRNVTNSAPTGLWLSDRTGAITYVNKILTEWTRTKYENLLGNTWINAIIEEDRAATMATFLKAVAEKGHYDIQFRLKKGDGRIIWCRAAGDPYYGEDGSYAGHAGYCMDVEELLAGRDALAASEKRFRSIVEQAPMAIGLLTGKDLVIETGNNKIFELWRKDSSVTGMRLIDALPEIKDQVFPKLLNEVYQTGNPYYGNAAEVRLLRNGQEEYGYFDFAYTPLRNAANQVTSIMVLAVEVTEQTLARRRIEESEARFRSLIVEAPFATALYTGRDLTIHTANEVMIKLWGKDESVIGKQLHLALPELQGQPFLTILDEVFTSGVAYHTQDAKVDLVVDNRLQSFYFNFTYKPLRNEHGAVYAILNMAVDVTDQVIARKKIEAAEEALRGAIELAELGTWSVDLQTNTMTYSDRTALWFGFNEGEKVPVKKVLNALADTDSPKAIAALSRIVKTGNHDTYNIECTLKAHVTGRERILHAQGKIVYNNAGKPVSITGTAQDVTRQRQVQTALEQLVQERTEELAATNEELQAANEELAVTNEELAATNEELTDTNGRLLKSNEELAQYAYVASHDLQEPLRKIRVFSGLLNDQQQLPAESKPLIGKIAQSAERMALLIGDLLAFSKLLNSENLFSEVSLQNVVSNVINDFELIITEKQATIHTAPLPDVQAIPLQMNQLVYNLVNNALKFQLPDAKPVITIGAVLISQEEAGAYCRKTLPFARYYHITVADNGIGFDPEFADKIFEVFKRLHNRHVYAGSGIGLALCRRIAENHHGALYATSQVGAGSVFHIILPDRQKAVQDD